MILDRKKNWIGHVVRGDGLMKLVLEERMEGKRPRGRPRMGIWNSHSWNSQEENLEAKELPLDRELTNDNH